MTSNDKKIFNLKEKLEIKKKALGKKPNVALKTNCVFTLFGNTYNLHVMNEFELSMVLNMFSGLNKEMKVGNFTVNDYIFDIQNKLALLDYNNCLASIKSMESKLNALISSETKTSIEIDKLAEQIG